MIIQICRRQTNSYIKNISSITTTRLQMGWGNTTGLLWTILAVLCDGRHYVMTRHELSASHRHVELESVLTFKF